jgi:transposase
VTKYLGRITPKGVIERKIREEVRSIYEYGNSEFLFRIAQDTLGALKRLFFSRWKEIAACAIVKTIQPLSLKLIKTRWEKLHLSQLIDAHLSPNTLSDMIREVGRDYLAQKEFFEELMKGSKVLAFDLSSIFSYSENLAYAEKGYNPAHLYLKQINFMMFFSIDKQLPVLLKPLPGSVRDIKAIKAVIDELRVKDLIVVLDRGFASYDLPTLLKENGFSFVLPMRRSFTKIDYGMRMENAFTYRGRGIKWSRRKMDKCYIYLFEDVKLRAEEETTFIQLMEEGKKSKEAYAEESKKFGKIAVLSNLERGGEEIYLLYKDRENIETAFDALKNELENDKTYLDDEDAVRGYFFISFVSLYLYYKILKRLKEKGLGGKVSVAEVLLELSKVYEINMGVKKKLSEIPEKVEKLANLLELDIFPKKLGS